MEWYHWIMIGLGVAGFVLQTLLLAIGGTYKFAEMEARITEKITDHRTDVAKALDVVERAAVDRADSVRREFGETVTAMRQRAEQTQAELQTTRQWALETFARRDSVNSAMDRIDNRLTKIDDKLDKMAVAVAAKTDT
ncbi:MAG TPA: hypothetical protein VNQ50_03720 [Xanthobacteraceae bacterium]|nr:hypothetical protein [Xanthobacteraceae bacterium]